MGDELYEVRNALVLGNFHQVIAEGSAARTALKKPEDVQNFNVERDSLVARAQVGLGQYEAVFADLGTATNPTLVAVRNFATFQRDLAAGLPTDAPIEKLVGALPANATPEAAAQAVLAAAALIAAGDFSQAMKISSQWASDLDSTANARQVIECKAILVDALLRLNRPDLAEKQVNEMKTIDDEATLTLLSSGLVALRQGATKPDRYSTAISEFNDVTARCGQSVMVLNLLALTNMGRGKVAEAERNLLDALTKKSGDADTIANLVVVASQLSKPTEATQRYLSQARAAQPRSSWATQYAALETRFADACRNLEE